MNEIEKEYQFQDVWTNFTILTIKGEKKKAPVNPHTLRNGSSTDSKRWGTLYDVKKNLGKPCVISVQELKVENGKKIKTWKKYPGTVDGIGIVFTGCDLMGLDFDHVLDDSGNLAPEVKAIVEKADSYTEISPSGHGLHILAKGKRLEPDGAQRVHKGETSKGTEPAPCEMEFYDTSRYFTFTGKEYSISSPLAERTKEFDEIYRKYMKVRKEEKPTTVTVPSPSTSSQPLTVADVLEKMFKAGNGMGEKNRKLYAGDIDIPEYYHTDGKHQGEPDKSLCDFHLAESAYIFSNLDESITRQIMLSSGLVDPKWDETGHKKADPSATILDWIMRTAREAAAAQLAKRQQKNRTMEIPKSKWIIDMQKNAISNLNESKPQLKEALKKILNGRLSELTIQDEDLVKKLYHVAHYELDPQAPKPLPKPKEFSMTDYLKTGELEKRIAYFAKYKDRKTGYANLDRYLTLYPGLAILGAVPSLGKTTFCMNIAENLVRAGHTVLYIALEQDPMELATKVLARNIFERYKGKSYLTNIDIKNGESDPYLEKAKAEMAENLSGLHLVKGNFNTTVEDIVELIDDFIATRKVTPIVFIDYLQLIAPSYAAGDGVDYRSRTQREICDHSLKVLKSYQMKDPDTSLLIWLVSSFNRNSYQAPADYSSFKETGGIEYTCDYVFALQPSVMSEKTYFYKESKTKSGGTTKKETSIYERQKKFEDALKGQPLDSYKRPVKGLENYREIQFKSIKNRNGMQKFDAFFRYHPAADSFVISDKYGVQENLAEAADFTADPVDDGSIDDIWE